MSTLRSSTARPRADQSDYFLYVGVYGKGVYAYRYNTKSAKIDPLGVTGQVVNPSFLATDSDFRYLYAVSELEGKAEGGVAGFAINRTSGALQALNQRGSAGQAPCHLSVDHSAKMLMVANYGTGGVSVFPLESDGGLGARSALMTAKGSSVNRKRQEGPHAHETVVSADNRLLYVPDLGLDQIRIYKIDTTGAKLTANDPPFAKAEPGFGPRHIAFSPNNKFAYVANELKSYVTVFARESNGGLRQIQALHTLPAGFQGENAPAEVEISPSGKFLYVSNRGPGTIAVFAINSGNGSLRQIQVASTDGTWPRGIAIDPSGDFLLAGDQKANRFVLLKIDRAHGKLTLTDRRFDVPSPVAFLFVPARS